MAATDETLDQVVDTGMKDPTTAFAENMAKIEAQWDSPPPEPKPDKPAAKPKQEPQSKVEEETEVEIKPEPKPKKEEKPAPPKPDDDFDKRQQPKSTKEWEAAKAAWRERVKAAEQERDKFKGEVGGYSTKVAEWDKTRVGLEKQRDELKAAVEQLKTAGPPKELEELKSELKRLQRELDLVDLERNPQFVSHYTAEENRRIERAKQLVGPEKSGQIEALLKRQESPERDAAIDEVVSDLPDRVQKRIDVVLEELEGVRRERSSEIERMRKDGETIFQERATKAEQAKLEARQRAEQLTELSLRELAESDSVKPVWSDETYKLAKAMAMTTPSDPATYKSLVQTLAKGLLHPKLIQERIAAEQTWKEQMDALKAELEESRKESDSLKAASPGMPKVAGAGKGHTESDEEPPDNPMEMGAWAARRAARFDQQ